MEEKKLFELLRIFREKVSKIDKSKYQKSVDSAVQLRIEGNEAFSRKEFEKSVQLYSEVSDEDLCVDL